MEEQYQPTEIELVIDDLSRQVAEKSQQAAMWRAKAIGFQAELQRLQALTEEGPEDEDLDKPEV